MISLTLREKKYMIGIIKMYKAKKFYGKGRKNANKLYNYITKKFNCIVLLK